MIVYRIGDCRFIDDLTGKGAAMYGGRWNNKDVYMVYTAQSRALALLEAVVHMGRLPGRNFCMAAIDIPDDSVLVMDIDNLPPGWHNNPPPDFLKRIGDRFISSGEYLAMSVPSVVMMEENNYLLNPAHPLFKKVKIISQRPVAIDGRLIKGQK